MQPLYKPRNRTLIQDIRTSVSPINGGKVAHTPIGVLGDWWDNRISVDRNRTMPVSSTYTRVAPLSILPDIADMHESLFVRNFHSSETVIANAAAGFATHIRRSASTLAGLLAAIQVLPKKYSVNRGLLTDLRTPLLTNLAKFGVPIIAAVAVGSYIALLEPTLPGSSSVNHKAAAKGTQVIDMMQSGSWNSNAAHGVSNAEGIACAMRNRGMTSPNSMIATTKSTNQSTKPTAAATPATTNDQPAVTIPVITGGMGGGNEGTTGTPGTTGGGGTSGGSSNTNTNGTGIIITPPTVPPVPNPTTGGGIVPPVTVPITVPPINIPLVNDPQKLLSL